VLAFFREKGTLIEIDGEQAPEHIGEELFTKLQALG
jgi:hypothetical protein